MLSGGIQENMIKTFETHPPGCAYPGLSVVPRAPSIEINKVGEAARRVAKRHCWFNHKASLDQFALFTPPSLLVACKG